MMLITVSGICFLIVVIGCVVVKTGQTYPLLGLFFAGLFIWFLVATCQEYNEMFPDEEEQQRRREEHMREFNRKIEAEKKYYHEKWERENQEEAAREREREEWRKEHGYK